MEAAHITWRPLGQLFVERGLITQDELEEALVEQEETHKRLGAILIARGLVSGPELTSVLVDQLGMELTKESGFGSGLWDEIRRRQPRGSDRQDGAEPTKADGAAAAQAPPKPAAPPKPKAKEAPARKVDEAVAKELAAFEEERAELQAALGDALQELMQVRAGNSSRTTDLEDLANQVTDLRRQVQESTAAVAAQQRAASRVKELEQELAAEQARRRAHAEELDFARTEASAEARELRESVERLRGELEQLDAATSWFEYWSGAVDPTSKG